MKMKMEKEEKEIEKERKKEELERKKEARATYTEKAKEATTDRKMGKLLKGSSLAEGSGEEAVAPKAKRRKIADEIEEKTEAKKAKKSEKNGLVEDLSVLEVDPEAD